MLGTDTKELKPIQIDVLNNTLGYLLAHNEADKEVYKLWKEYFEDCQQFNRFKVEYSRKGIQCGCPVYSASETGKIFYADETVVNIFGCRNYMEFYKYVGGSFKTMVYSDDIERVEEEIAEQFRKSEDNIDRVKYRIVRKDGSVRMIDDIGRKVFTENGSSVFYAYIVDVTDEKP